MGRVDAGKRCVVGDGMNRAIPELDRMSGSWAIVDPDGRCIYELFDRHNVVKALKARPHCKAITIYEYLVSLNCNAHELKEGSHLSTHKRKELTP